MTKADLRTGMIITCRNGTKYVIMKDFYGSDSGMISVGKDGWSNWNDIDNYANDLTYKNDNWDIVKVEKFKYRSAIAEFMANPKANIALEKIWERSEKKKYTYSQLKETLGEEFEIVKE